MPFMLSYAYSQLLITICSHKIDKCKYLRVGFLSYSMHCNEVQPEMLASSIAAAMILESDTLHLNIHFNHWSSSQDFPQGFFQARFLSPSAGDQDFRQQNPTPQHHPAVTGKEKNIAHELHKP